MVHALVEAPVAPVPLHESPDHDHLLVCTERIKLFVGPPKPAVSHRQQSTARHRFPARESTMLLTGAASDGSMEEKKTNLPD
jgi:hypothetical protein